MGARASSALSISRRICSAQSHTHSKAAIPMDLPALLDKDPSCRAAQQSLTQLTFQHSWNFYNTAFLTLVI